MKQMLILLFFFVFQNGYGQPDNPRNQGSEEKGIRDIEIKKNFSEYYINRKRISLFNCEIINKSHETIYFWFYKGNSNSLSDSVIICNYFKKRRGVVGSFFQMALDFNIESFVPEIFTSLLKKIQPEESFLIQIRSKGRGLDTTKIETFMKDHSISYTSSKISKYVPIPIENFNEIVFFKDDFLFLDMKDL